MATNPYEMGAGLLDQSANMYQSIGEGGALQNINSYLNPYYDQVIANTTRQMGDTHQQNINNIGASATAANAFGGDRHGIVEGVATGEYTQNVGDMTAALQQQNFNQASNAARSDMFGSAQGLFGAGNNYLNVGNQVAANQGAIGNQQQMLAQQILEGGSGAWEQMMQNPYQMIDMFQSLIQGSPLNNAGMSTESSTPGLYDYLSLAAQAASGP